MGPTCGLLSACPGLLDEVAASIPEEQPIDFLTPSTDISSPPLSFPRVKRFREELIRGLLRYLLEQRAWSSWRALAGKVARPAGTGPARCSLVGVLPWPAQ